MRPFALSLTFERRDREFIALGRLLSRWRPRQQSSHVSDHVSESAQGEALLEENLEESQLLVEA